MELFPSSENAFFNLRDEMEFAFESNQAGKFDLIIKSDQSSRATRVL